MPTYKFRILLDTENDEEIFRDIQISSDIDFEQFYRAIISAFEFEGNQLASFYVSNDNWDRGQEIALMDMGLDKSINAPFIMSETPVNKVVHSENQKLILVYDFLKMWCFLIELIEISTQKIELPTVSLSIGNPPHENDKEIDFDQSITLGSDIDDIFSEFNEEDTNDFGAFENIDDLDI